MAYTVYYPSGECDTLLPDHVCTPCDEVEHGRVGSVALIHQSVLASIQIDPSNPTPWHTAINNKMIIIIPEVSGTYDGGTPVTGPGYGRLKERVTGFDFVVAFKDPTYKANALFYNSLLKSHKWVIAFNSENFIHIPDAPASYVPKNEITDDIDSEVVWSVEAKFSQGSLPVPFDIPAGIFDSCFAYNA